MNPYKEKFVKIRHKLQYPRIVLEMMEGEDVNKNKVPPEFIEDGLKAIKQISRLIGQIERGIEGGKRNN